MMKLSREVSLRVIPFLLLLFIFSCSTNNPLTTITQNKYNKIYTAEYGDTKFEIYSATSDSLVAGYNDIGFKVYIDSQKMNSGFVTFYPKMYHHFIGSPTHSTPMSPKFYYDAAQDLFTGYAVFLMWTDTSTSWYGWYNYNNVNHVDSAIFAVQPSPFAQVRDFVDNSSETDVVMTLVTPFHPKQGMNDFRVICHRTIDNINYWEADSLEMSILPWMQFTGHSSTGNVNPVWQGGGMYKGVINLDSQGEWYIYDTVRYRNTLITPIPPPKFILESP